MDPLISAYCSTLSKSCPSLGKSFEQVVDIRTSSSHADHYIHFDYSTDSEDLSRRVNTAINKQKRVSCPSTWCPMEPHATTLTKFTGNTCKTYQSIAELLPKLSWYDPEFPARGGWVLAGSSARPSQIHHQMSVRTYDRRFSALGVAELHVKDNDVYLPKHSGDIDLFLVVGGTDDAIREMVGRAHINDIMIDGYNNPMNAVMSDGSSCALCGRDAPRLYYTRCTGCSPRVCVPYTYAAKHVVAYSVPGGPDVQFITRVYKNVDLIVPRFDMTVDGAIFSPKMGLRILPIALQEWRNGIMLLSPFSGSSTMNERVYKKLDRYGIIPVIPGYVENLHHRGIVFALTAARTILPGMSMRAAIRECKKLPLQYRTDVINLYHANFCTTGLLKRIRTIETMKKQLLEDEETTQADEYAFSRASECKSYSVPNTSVKILTDLQENTGSSGSFQALTVEETLMLMSFHCDPTPSSSLKEDSAEPEPPQLAMVTVPPGNMDKITLKKVKRTIPVFTYDNQNVFLNNLFINKSALEVTGLSYVLIGTSQAHNCLKFAIVGDSFLKNQKSEMGAQIWSIRVKSINDAPMLKCITESGLYTKDAYVCMGAQSHFHEGADALARGVQFSLLALIVSVTDRAKILMDRHPEHIESVGVMKPMKSDEHVLEHHKVAYERLSCAVHEWVYKIEL